MSDGHDMNAVPRRRRLAATLCRHAAGVLPDSSPWAQAMRRELDYIANDRAALDWALGCVIASYRIALAARAAAGIGWLRRLFQAQNPAALVLRHAALSGALMLAIGLALLENAGGQTPPPPPVIDETACDIADKAADFGPDLRGRTPPSVEQAPDASCPGWSASGRTQPLKQGPSDVPLKGGRR
jgi:hypothetical protein